MTPSPGLPRGSVVPLRILPPVPDHIPVYCPPPVPCLHADRVVFLDELHAVRTHYQIGTSREDGRSRPCPGDGCPDCQAGFEIRLAVYAAAVVSGMDTTADPPTQRPWQRVVYYLPQGAAGQFQHARQRGRHYSVWRQRVGSSQRIRSRFEGLAAELVEPAFDIWPVLQHLFAKSPTTRAELDRLLNTLPAEVTPPVFGRPQDDPPAATVKVLTREEMRAMMADKIGWQPKDRAKPGLASNRLLEQLGLAVRPTNGTA